MEEKKLINPYGITIGETITAYNSGIQTVVDIQPKDDSLEVTYNQIYGMDGRAINMNRPAKCDISCCKPAMLLLPEYKRKLKWMIEFIRFLESESQRILK